MSECEGVILSWFGQLVILPWINIVFSEQIQYCLDSGLLLLEILLIYR